MKDNLISMEPMLDMYIFKTLQFSVIYGMPKITYNICAVEYQEPLENISSHLYSVIAVNKIHKTIIG